MAAVNWRTINIDLMDPESSANFSTASLSPSVPHVSAAEVQSLGGQVRQLLRGGDAEGALRGALENAPYGGDTAAKVRDFIREPVQWVEHSEAHSCVNLDMWIKVQDYRKCI